MSDLLKEAIADAKAVRETALQNAKMALEEAFTPQLKSMLSAKLKEDEMGDEEEEMSMEDEMGDEEEGIPAEVASGNSVHKGYAEDEVEDEMGGEEEFSETSLAQRGNVPLDASGHVTADDTEPEEDPWEDRAGGSKEFHETSVAPDKSPEAFEDEEGEEELDLESIIRELESELDDEEPVAEQDDAYDEKNAPEKDGLAEEDDAYPEAASKEDKNDGKSSSTLAEGDDDDDDDDDTVDEQSDSSKIGNGDNVVDSADSSDEEDPGKGEMHEQLQEYKDAVRFLKNKLHEVNILNAKLLFTNKLFKEFVLNNNQKLKVVETFDRAQTTREIKLVYATLAEQFMGNGSISRKKSISESASKSVGSTKPSQKSRKVISEETEVANRFKKLAGLIK